ncbi:hypothetical protein SAMN04488028_10819 [Reichenbachiella agariperforans]|uniref:Uncharacterized protein n=1 Tax=Reichenbachiella agariperforans TaxID=156994 RepID=A0A1M6UWB1_REIAG|nr:hypothetical protein [Reichenbachiella agariperforans]SHK73433.1 hypothetical protein SAMN04488028_10819 [Reichenbachiella agariperforans]
MKIPSFIKTSRYSRFHIEPRYYDPIKEEIEGKMKAARERLNRQGEEGSSIEYQSSISAAFGKRERRSGQTSIVQLGLAMAIFALVVGWLFFGNDVFYVFLLLSPLYFYFRLRKRKAPRD